MLVMRKGINSLCRRSSKIEGNNARRQKTGTGSGKKSPPSVVRLEYPVHHIMLAAITLSV